MECKSKYDAPLGFSLLFCIRLAYSTYSQSFLNSLFLRRSVLIYIYMQVCYTYTGVFYFI